MDENGTDTDASLTYGRKPTDHQFSLSGRRRSHTNAVVSPVRFPRGLLDRGCNGDARRSLGRRYLELNRGNLRQKDWQEVADAFNGRHGHTKKTRRTDVQCKNRIDTLNKKYKVEKARVSVSGFNWPFYSRMDTLIGVAVKKSSSSPPSAVPLPYWIPPPAAMLTNQSPQPVTILPQKRPLPVAAATLDDSYFRRNYTAVAAAAEEDGSEDDESMSASDREGAADGADAAGVRRGGRGGSGSMTRLSRAIERFGEIYERVEGEKQKQMVELEKQRMQLIKDLEIQRMQLFMDTQVQLEKIKQAKRPVSDDGGGGG